MTTAERGRWPQATRRANAFFEAVLSATPDFTYVTDLATGLIIFGSHDGAILGKTSAQLQSLGSEAQLALVHPDDHDRLRTANKDAGAIDDGQVVQLRFRAAHADGQWRWLSRRVTPFRRDSSGPVTAIKLDRSFTAGLPHDETSLKIVTALAGLAADLQIGCVVEGRRECRTAARPTWRGARAGLSHRSTRNRQCPGPASPGCRRGALTRPPRSSPLDGVDDLGG